MIVIPEISEHTARDALTYLVEQSSQREVARALGVHHNSVYGWLHGREMSVVVRMAVMWLSERWRKSDG
jgi:transposase-like protein